LASFQASNPLKFELQLSALPIPLVSNNNAKAGILYFS
jgi:hypothetical protein